MNDLFLQAIKQYSSSNELPSHSFLFEQLDLAVNLLEKEVTDYRPKSRYNNLGGLLDFSQNNKKLPCIIVPDLHGRRDFLKNILEYVPPVSFWGNDFNNSNNQDNIQKNIAFGLQNGLLNVVCVGDAMHSELRGKQRWLDSFEFFINDIYDSEPMIQEMIENLWTLMIICLLKINFPKNFHFLKGNHENIMNASFCGDFSFCKFAQEGEMVKAFIQKKYGDDILMMINYFEKALPLACVLHNSIISHAEPITYFSKNNIINGLSSASVIQGLTWTANNTAEEGSVIKMLNDFLVDSTFKEKKYFAGHRPVFEKYKLRQEGSFVQLHNPEEQNICLIYANKEINLDTDIVSVNSI